MEADQLLQVFKQVAVWPKNQSEMDDVAEKILDLVGINFVALISNRLGEGMGIKFSRSFGPVNINREKFSNYIKDQIRKTTEGVSSFKRVDLPSNNFYLPSLDAIQNISYIGLVEYGPRVPKDFGGIVLGSIQPLTPKAEMRAMIISQRLLDLARIADLESAVQIRGQFLSIASHELKTPLTSIYGILQLQERMLRLKTDQTPFPDQDRHHNFLKMVIRQVERLNELIDGLLDVSRIQNGRFMVEPSETDVAALLRECTQTRLSVIAHEAGVKLHIESVPNLQARVDPVRMEEVISNLIMNAIRFSPEGGVIWIRLREEEGAFRLTVRDQGPSIAMEDRERIFQPFERAQRTARMGGLGLGLFISRQIAQLHGGNVSLLESVPGKGNVFEAYFPMRTSQLAFA